VASTHEAWFSHAELRASIERSVPGLSDATFESITDQLVREGLLVRAKRFGVAGYQPSRIGMAMVSLQDGRGH
jgi:hypothetical protein